jgi:hypothetical protein
LAPGTPPDKYRAIIKKHVLAYDQKHWNTGTGYPTKVKKSKMRGQLSEKTMLITTKRQDFVLFFKLLKGTV